MGLSNHSFFRVVTTVNEQVAIGFSTLLLRKLHDFPTKPIDSKEVTPRPCLKKKKIKNTRTRVVREDIGKARNSFRDTSRKNKGFETNISPPLSPTHPNSVGMNVGKNKSVITSK